MYTLLIITGRISLHFDSLWICGRPVLPFHRDVSYDVTVGVGLGVSPPHLPYISVIKSSSHMLLC